MVLILGSLQLGLLYGLLAMGIYISFRILNVPDLTAEGSFTLGLAVSASLTVAGHPVTGLAVAMLAGALAGCVTGLLQTKCKIHPVLAGILTMSGLYSVNLCIMGSSSNLSLISNATVFKLVYGWLPGMDKDICKLLIAGLAAVVSAAALILFFRTHIGLCIRATGDNEDMVRASSIDVHGVKILALAVSNSVIALCGALIAQYQGFADINSGVGILVVGLASVIIGKLFVRSDKVGRGLVISIVGSVIYRYIIALATSSSLFPAYALKLVSAVIVGMALSAPAWKEQLEVRKIRKGGKAHAEH